MPLTRRLVLVGEETRARFRGEFPGAAAVQVMITEICSRGTGVEVSINEKVSAIMALPGTDVIHKELVPPAGPATVLGHSLLGLGPASRGRSGGAADWRGPEGCSR
jgi:hypothetical protein